MRQYVLNYAKFLVGLLGTLVAITWTLKLLGLPRDYPVGGRMTLFNGMATCLWCIIGQRLGWFKKLSGLKQEESKK